MSKLLEALHFVGMITLERHVAGGEPPEFIKSNDEAKAVAKLKEYEEVLRDLRCKRIVRELIEAFEAQRG